MREGRWTTVTPSQFAHEREALEHIRTLLPDAEPYRAWSNFTFTQLATDGSDTGHYFVASDNDGGLALQISIGSNQTTLGELGYYVGLGGAIVTPFAP